MALFRVPSKKIQYGYVEVDIDTAGLLPGEVARLYMDYVSTFQMAEIEYVEGKVAAPSSRVEADEPTAETPPTEEEAVDIVVDNLGATEVPETEKPWEKEAPAAPAPKPWDKAPTFDWS